MKNLLHFHLQSRNTRIICSDSSYSNPNRSSSYTDLSFDKWGCKTFFLTIRGISNNVFDSSSNSLHHSSKFAIKILDFFSSLWKIVRGCLIYYLSSKDLNCSIEFSGILCSYYGSSYCKGSYGEKFWDAHRRLLLVNMADQRYLKASRIHIQKYIFIYSFLWSHFILRFEKCKILVDFSAHPITSYHVLSDLTFVLLFSVIL